MSSPIRRNSSKPYVSQYSRDSYDHNGVNGVNGTNGTIPNVMTSPAIFASETTGSKGFRHASELADIEEDSFTASSVTDVPKPPDGGWGWAVVLASFMIHVLGQFSNCNSFFDREDNSQK